MELGIDLGTSSTVAFLRRDDGPAEPVLFDGAPLLPSAVFADAGGELLVGRDAVHAARARPERFEGNPKRRIDDGTVFLGAEVPVETLLGALLRRVAVEAERIDGTPVAGSTVCHPAAWGPARRATLHRAAVAAGLGAVRLVAEPVAAAAFHLRRHGTAPADLLVYDLGAGTFDVAVVRHAPDSATERMQVLCSAGLDETGGQDVDAAIVDLLRRRSGSPELWTRLDHPETVADRAARRQLWDDVRNAKEMLSRTSSALLYLPLLDTDQLVTREELEQLAAPLIQRTVNAVGAALAECRVPLRPLGAVVLVGGASRMPLVATMLHRALGIAPTITDQPELVVAAGSIDPLLAAPVSGAGPSWPAPTSGAGAPQPVSGAGPSWGLSSGNGPSSGGAPPGWGPSVQPPAPPYQPGYPQHPQAYPQQAYVQRPYEQQPYPHPQASPQQPYAQQVPQVQAPQGPPPQPMPRPPVPQPVPPYRPRPQDRPQPYPQPQPQPPVGQPWAPGAGAPQAVLTAVELLTVTTPRRHGVTLRGQLRGAYGVVEHVFPTDDDGRLIIFPDTMSLARYAAAHPGDALVATPPWQVRNDGTDELHFDLQLLLEHLAGPPGRWLPSFACRCRDLCAQLVVFLGLGDADDLLGEHSTIDQADDILRRHLADVPGRAAQRRLAKLDQSQLVEDWTDLITLIDEHTAAAPT